MEVKAEKREIVSQGHKVVKNELFKSIISYYLFVKQRDIYLLLVQFKIM